MRPSRCTVLAGFAYLIGWQIKAPFLASVIFKSPYRGCSVTSTGTGSAIITVGALSEVSCGWERVENISGQERL